MMERTDPKRLLARLLGPAEPEVGCDVCFEDSTATSSSSSPVRTPMPRFPGFGHTSKAARPAGRSTRASCRSSATAEA